jgi:small-conductance mechanosensitive channel
MPSSEVSRPLPAYERSAVNPFEIEVPMRYLRYLRFSLKRAISASFWLVFFTTASCVQAADEVPQTAVNKTIVASLQPIIKLFGNNAWLQGIAAILVTFTVASLITWILFKLLRKIISRTKFGGIDDQIVVLLRPPVYYTLVVSGISYGFSIMPLAETVELISSRCIKSLGVVVWIIFCTRLASMLLIRLATLSHKVAFIQLRTLTLFDNLAKILIFSVGIYTIFVIWKIDMTAWLASAGIAGIAVGFAAKDTLSNLFSGVFILADAPYKVGDYIVLDQRERGKVTQIGLRSSRILTRDDVEITIPNSIIGNSTIINQSGGPSEKMRIKVKVGVAYGSDVDQVRALMLDMAEKDPLVCKSPPPTVRFIAFGASSLDFELRCWVPRPELSAQVIDTLNTAVYKEFRRAEVEIPYAKQDLYIKEIPASFGAELVVKQLKPSE